jgi:hypothetical protein
MQIKPDEAEFLCGLLKEKITDSLAFDGPSPEVEFMQDILGKLVRIANADPD